MRACVFAAPTSRNHRRFVERVQPRDAAATRRVQGETMLLSPIKNAARAGERESRLDRQDVDSLSNDLR